MANTIVAEPGLLTLPIVDALELDPHRRELLRPDAVVSDGAGERRLPRYFYEVDSWQTALNVRLTENFTLHELMGVDVREAQPLRIFPRYVPCAVTLLAAHLEIFRQKVGTFVHVAANGGYRSPAHRLSRAESTHCWATAANIYKVGDEYLDSQEQIERFARVFQRLLPSVWVRPYGHKRGAADDHLHVDVGYAVLVPHSSFERKAG
jgi:hypothetical protein